MATTNHTLNSEANKATETSIALSQRSQLLKTCRNLFGAKDLEPEESKFWARFLSEFSLAELRYAFENWNKNGHWFPKPSDIKELAEAYRLSGTQLVTELPVGCPRCEWSGWYTVTWRSRTERAVAPCPCRTNVALRTLCDKPMASSEEVAGMWAQIQKLAEEKSMEKKPKPKQVSGVIPTTVELAGQLAKHKPGWKAS